MRNFFRNVVQRTKSYRNETCRELFFFCLPISHLYARQECGINLFRWATEIRFSGISILQSPFFTFTFRFMTLKKIYLIGSHKIVHNLLSVLHLISNDFSFVIIYSILNLRTQLEPKFVTDTCRVAVTWASYLVNTALVSTAIKRHNLPMR